MAIDFDEIKKHGFYVYSEKTNSIRRIFDQDGLTIYFMEGVVHNIKYLEKLINPDSYFFAIIPHYTYPTFFERTADFLFKSFGEIGLKNIIWLANTEEQLQEAQKMGISSIYCNHNCWLDINIFKPDEDNFAREFDLVLNCRPETLKNPQLTMGIPNLAIIKGINHSKDTYWDLMQLNPSYINDIRLSTNEVVSILNKSKIGGIFSEKEGACYSSSEFILCGLPVLSIASEGGRDVWFDNSNSLIVTKSVEGVRDGVAQAKEMLINGSFNRRKIRESHLYLASRFVNEFKSELSNIFIKYSISIDIEHFYNSIYFHKMTKYGDEIYIG